MEKENKQQEKKEIQDQIKDAFINNFQVTSLLNRDGDILPFGYFNPKSEGKIFWMCDYDQDRKITSIIQYDYEGQKGRKIEYLENMEKALYYRDEFVKDGWKKIVPPKVEFTMEDGRPLNRQEKRFLAKKMKQDPNFLDKAFSNK